MGSNYFEFLMSIFSVFSVMFCSEIQTVGSIGIDEKADSKGKIF